MKFKNLLLYTAVVIGGLIIGKSLVFIYDGLTKPEFMIIADNSQHYLGIDADVIMYGASWCPVCLRSRTFFEQYNINFIEYDTETINQNILKRYLSLNISSVPVIIIGDKIFRGFDEQIIKNELKRLKLL